MADNGQTRTARREQKKQKKKPIWKKILLSILLVGLVMLITAGGIITYWIATAPSIDASQLSDPYASSLLDKDGNEFAVPGEPGSEKRVKVEYEDLPQVLIDAVIATEDARFFEHPGIDIRRIGGAVIANIQEGFGAEGASTITQQVVEKSFLSPEKKLSIKVQEAWLALQLEQQYSKEEILEMYLNKIFYGNHAYGVAQAAETYFGKSDLHDLTLPEAAILAGLPQRPTAYNPFENPELTKERMDTVLSLMVRHGKITEEEAQEASEVDISSLLVESRPEPTQYEAFIKQVEYEVQEKLGADINTDGLVVHTTLDPAIQDHVEFLLSDSADNPIGYPDDEMQAGMTVLDTKTGAIQAIGGNRETSEDVQYNYAIQGEGMQAGSTAKPIVSYGPAIEYNQMSTYHQINDDAPYDFGGDAPIRNWNRQYAGWMTARHALNQSLNVPAVKVLEEVGLENAKEFAESIGYEFHDDQITIGDAIGGTSTTVTPLELAGAYRAFGNQGIYNEPFAVTKVEFPDGTVEELTPEPEAVMSDHTAYMITDMLKTVVSEGTGTRANVDGLPIAGKTGTTNLENVSGSPDAWFAGYTTNYTISVWTGGYTDEDENRAPIPDGYTHISQDLFRNTMSQISQGIETADFVQPESVVEVEVENGSNPPKLPSAHTPSSNIVTELFVKGTEPNATSERFDQLDSVSGLSAEYDEEANTIQVDWNYDTEEDVSFEVSSSVNGGGMEVLSSTEDTSIEISEVEPGNTYEIQVVAVSNETDSQSEPATTSVTTGEEEIPAVSGLTATYNEENDVIDVSWNYDGPDASFEVSINGQTQSVESTGIEISGAPPGETYTIAVTSVGQDSDERGETQSTEVTIPGNEEETEQNNEEQQQEEETEQNEEQGTEQNEEQQQEQDSNGQSEEPDENTNEEQQQEQDTEQNEETDSGNETGTNEGDGNDGSEDAEASETESEEDSDTESDENEEE